MAGLKRFQYIGKDHDSIVNDCVARIKEAYPEKWNDFYEDSAGMMLVEIFAYVVDLLLFYLERQANETYLPTATERQNLLNMCKLVGYKVSNARPAEVELLFFIREAIDSDVLIPKGTLVESAGGVVFETRAEMRIFAGSLSVTIAAVEGETFSERIGISDGSRNQEFYLPRATVVEVRSIQVDGIEWKAVDSVADQMGDASVYMVDMDAFGRAIIMFGDGINGRIPESDTEIVAEYRVGGGIVGNVASDTITTVRQIIYDERSDRVQIAVTNPEPASGGTDPESISRIRLWAPRYFETQGRCVTQQDYETTAMTFQDADAGAIAKAKAIVRERSGEANIIRIYVLAYSDNRDHLALASQPLKDALLSYIDTKKMFTDWIEIEDGSWRFINFKGTLRLVPGLQHEVILGRVKDALRGLLDVDLQEMGGILRISDVYATIDGTEGVQHVELDEPLKSVQAQQNEVLLLGDVEFEVDEGVNDGTNT